MFGKFFSKKQSKYDKILTRDQYEFLDDLVDRYELLLSAYDAEIKGGESHINYSVIIETILRDYLYDRKKFKQGYEFNQRDAAHKKRAYRKKSRLFLTLMDEIAERYGFKFF